VTVQDDVRELELIGLFELERPDTGRSGTDAVLEIDGNVIEFELKSTTRGSVTTVRDFGPEHVNKWRGRHWLFGFYDGTGTTLHYCKYGSPKAMAPWISEKALYVKPDFDLADIVPGLLKRSDMNHVVGDKEKYSLSDASAIQKRQYSRKRYLELMDVKDGYTQDQMLEIVRARTKYLLRRGATLNNPHIPASYFVDWERITANHAGRLRELVRAALAESA